ncbi:unnamed protein product [Blepharisma stoltei]|uniref:Cache domain-containing protein n=1 Tax=Blepharisma stoltei TaxID=1481888 RepID=A0AAU9J0E6_9CILI|nr:unnamed protein product [Blepharisma stoltei]
MGLRARYITWPLGQQLQLTFITTGFLISLIVVIITQTQLDWLKSKMLDKSESVLKSSLSHQMTILAREKGRVVEQYLNNYFDLAYSIRELDAMMLGLRGYSEPIIVPNSPVWHDKNTDVMVKNQYGETVDYLTGVFMSPNENSLSDEGTEIVNDHAAMDQLYPTLFRNNTIYAIYTGFATDEIIHEYPGKVFTDTSYTPIVEEWYYKADEYKGYPVVTESYTNTETNTTIFTISTALVVNSSTYSVAAVDVTLYELDQALKDVTVLEDGFIILTSPKGINIIQPSTWDYLGTTAKIYEVTLGLSQSKWLDLVVNPDDTELNTFKDINGTVYYYVIEPVRPYADITNVTHYLLVCAKKENTLKPRDDLSNNFTKSYKIIFWVVFSIAITVFIIIALFIHFITSKISAQLKRIDKVFYKIIRRGLFSSITKGQNTAKLEEYQNGMESIVDSVLEKIEFIKFKEEKFSYYEWGITRPKDVMITHRWENRLYPLNLHHDKQMSWRHVLPKLTKISKKKLNST